MCVFYKISDRYSILTLIGLKGSISLTTIFTYGLYQFHKLPNGKCFGLMLALQKFLSVTAQTKDILSH